MKFKEFKEEAEREIGIRLKSVYERIMGESTRQKSFITICGITRYEGS
jgi:hypothetical protein